MDGFPTLPVEIVRLIILEAVQIRGLKRAVRLRFVNRMWDVEVVEAIFRWGILDSCNGLFHLSLFHSSFWPQYLPYKIFSSETPPYRNLCVIREVAKRVLTIRGECASNDAVKKCISQFATYGGWDWAWGWSEYVGEPVDEPIVIHDNDDDFKRALLVAAIITNDTALAKHQISHMRDSPRLFSDNQTFDIDDPTVIGYPTNTAASLGNKEVLTLLFEVIPDWQLFCARDDGAEFSAESKFATFELCQDPEPTTAYNDGPILIIERTLSPEVFEYMEIVCGAFMHAPGTRARKNVLMQRLENCFCHAVEKGNLDMMKYLITRGVVIEEFRIEKAGYSSDDDEPDTYCDFGSCWSVTLTTVAALRGYTEILQYLLENGAKIGHRSLEAACKHGNPECVKLLLGHGATDHFKPGRALLQCVKRENETVIRQLMASGMASGITMNDDVKKQMLDVIEKEGLVSMPKILEECN